MAKLPIGTEVLLIESGEVGILQSYLHDFLALVDVDGAFVKVHEKGIAAVSDFYTKRIKQEKLKSIFQKLKGIQIAFNAIKNHAQEIMRFDVYLVNHTDEHILFQYQYFAKQILQQKIRKELTSENQFLLHEFKLDQLNDSPLFEFEIWIKSPRQETENYYQEKLKIKPKQFFAKLDSPDFLADQFISFEILSELEQKKIVQVQEEKDFWEDKKPIKNFQSIGTKNNVVLQKAHMPDHIDLHIEKLERDFQKLSNGEIIQIQLRHFKNFLEKAIRLKLDRIYIIHGVGKGVLKNEIEKILKDHFEIESYNNQYHPRFGFGATEIILQKSSF